MKRMMVTVASAFLAFPSLGALQYEFRQKNTNEDAIRPSTELTARATVDGDRTRVDFLGGSVYPPGTYVVSTDGSRNLRFVDPTNQTFTEVSTESVATALGASNIKIENQKVNVQKLDDRATIAGIETQHYRVTMDYDITKIMRDVPLKQHVRTEIDAWTTSQFENARQDLFSSGAIKTGNADLDTLLEAETSKIAGFPLKQIVTIRTSYQRRTGSRLQTPTTRTITREIWVTSIKEILTRATDFVVPATYRRADAPDVPRWAPTVLTFEPSSK